MATFRRRRRSDLLRRLSNPYGLGAGAAVLAVAGLFAWLLLNAGDTRRRLEAAAPGIDVPIERGPVPAPKPAEPPVQTVAVAAAPVAAPVAAKSPLPAARGEAANPVLIPELVEPAAIGPLPRIAPDGRQPWKAYARPVDPADKRPRIALVVTGLGISDAQTEAALKLPATVTFAFNPLSEKLKPWVETARRTGHEVLMTVPMEPVAYPSDDPGPETLLATATPAENIRHLEWALSRGTGYVGIMNAMGARFLAQPPAVKPVFAALRQRGLLWLDMRAGGDDQSLAVAQEAGLPAAVVERAVDAVPTRTAIDQALDALETEARQRGTVVAVASPYPITLERLSAWIATLEGKGLSIVPISAVASVPGKSS